jgi:hypothetical protein
MGGKEMHKKSWYESIKERDHLEYLDIGERIILKWILRGSVVG